MTMVRTILGMKQMRITTRRLEAASMSKHCRHMNVPGGGAVDLTDGGESSGPWRMWPDPPGVLGGTYSGHGHTPMPMSAMRSGILVRMRIHFASGIQSHTARVGVPGYQAGVPRIEQWDNRSRSTLHGVVSVLLPGWA